MIELEKYSGSTSRHTCPDCGKAKKFTRYIDTETGRYLADTVGRCDRESSCGYHYTPKQYFADNSHLRNGNGWTFQTSKNIKNNSGMVSIGSKSENRLERGYEGHFSTKKPDYIENDHLLNALTNYDRNAFIQFLLKLFPFDAEDIWQAVNDYVVGTTEDGKTIFWQVDQNRKVRTGKIIAYSSDTGKRQKDIKPNWIHSELKKSNLLKSDFELRQCFFGEHLLTKYPGLPIAIVEAEKSAVIGSICKGVFPEMVWLACGGKSNLNAERLSQLGRRRTIVLYPDADGFEKWQIIASDARIRGLSVNVSDLIERVATDAERANGSDLADYLIRLQRERNDPANREAFRTLIEDRLANMTIDGGLTLEQAETEIVNSGFYQSAIRSVLGSA